MEVVTGEGNEVDHAADSADNKRVDAPEELENHPSLLKALLTLDFNELLYQGRSFTTMSAWVVLGTSTLAISAACYLLAEMVVLSADALSVPTYFTAVIFAAAATSVPDTFLSVKDAMNGNYDDALSNALGSNTFDITVALGFPLFLYAVLTGTAVPLTESGDIQILRVVLLAVTIVMLTLLLWPKRITVRAAYAMGGIYIAWLGFLIINSNLFSLPTLF